MIELLQDPWPWYVTGPLIGLIVPILLIMGGKQFGVSANLRHTCAACTPGKIEFFQYDWKKAGSWNLVFVLGTVAGGFLGGWLLSNPEPVNISQQTVAELQAMGIRDFSGLMPQDLFSWQNLTTLPGLTVMVLGGFLVGFGARYAGGCTSGHAISGLADLQFASLLAVLGFFLGGLAITYLVFPILL
ncbi:YeeE/YedE family protein [Aliifodinibius sp. S!AR15-10]|uniref:YeeE/YedE family protein n=1 Tax=Aliifodinibius sp. S!AR15-10 TaxID=2950437 RepID=UPI00285A1649|nr:YeeE/YedE thiosulfate transporter family protein [Aliifodinibius sp. S!AR15-10]MDR8393746.1 YeeE/YedE family protein [Aliifodinibius sp. S!AR15-10]